jgi:sugar/nucleoside kinase (ribokinase family)
VLAAALGQPSLLMANRIGDDSVGHQLHGWQRRHGVQSTGGVRADTATPRIVVVGDNQDTRTMFPYLPGGADELERVDLAPLSSASFAYIDAYQMLGKAATRVVQAAAAQLTFVVNLGGDRAPSELLNALDGYPSLIVQSRIAEESLEAATWLAQRLQSDIQADLAIVTAGKAGATAAGQNSVVSVTAYPAFVRHTDCAGAAFSGGLVFGLNHGWRMRDCLNLAAASGALRCERAHSAPLPSLGELFGVHGIPPSRDACGMKSGMTV